MPKNSSASGQKIAYIVSINGHFRLDDAENFDFRRLSVFTQHQLGKYGALVLDGSFIPDKSGCRPNEAAGLCWKDADWDSGRVSISRDITWIRRPELTWEWDTPKNKKSYRSFTLPKSFMHQLDAHRKAQLEQRMKLGRDWYDNDMVFTNEVGEPLSPTVQDKYWKKILAKTELTEERRKMRVYDLRHSVATLLLLSGRPAKIVSDRLGHSRSEVTMDIYQHVIERMQDQATESLEEAIFSGVKTIKNP